MPKNRFEYKIRCYFCDLVLKYKIQNKQTAISDARKRGWILGKYNKCPDCQKRPKRELNKIITDRFFNLRI